MNGPASSVRSTLPRPTAMYTASASESQVMSVMAFASRSDRTSRLERQYPKLSAEECVCQVGETTEIRQPALAGWQLLADQTDDDHGNAESADDARDLSDRAHQGDRIGRPRRHAQHCEEKQAGKTQ